jgi:hypothetical protein
MLAAMKEEKHPFSSLSLCYFSLSVRVLVLECKLCIPRCYPCGNYIDARKGLVE